MSIISVGLIINQIFEIKFSCKLRGNNKTVDSESSDEIYTNNQMSDSDEYEETSEETSEETQTNKKCSCEKCGECEKCNLRSSDKKITECSRACSCLELNNKSDDYSDMPPLIAHDDNIVTDDQENINNNSEQIIN